MMLVETFVRIVDAGSLSAAARALATTQPTISRRLKALEKSLGVRLLQRSTHAMKLTDDGVRCYARAKELIAGWQEFESEIRGAVDEPVGMLRVVAPHAFGQHELGRQVDLVAQHHAQGCLHVLEPVRLGDEAGRAGLDDLAHALRRAFRRLHAHGRGLEVRLHGLERSEPGELGQVVVEQQQVDTGWVQLAGLLGVPHRFEMKGAARFDLGGHSLQQESGAVPDDLVVIDQKNLHTDLSSTVALPVLNAG